MTKLTSLFKSQTTAQLMPRVLLYGARFLKTCLILSGSCACFPAGRVKFPKATASKAQAMARGGPKELGILGGSFASGAFLWTGGAGHAEKPRPKQVFRRAGGVSFLTVKRKDSTRFHRAGFVSRKIFPAWGRVFFALQSR